MDSVASSAQTLLSLKSTQSRSFGLSKSMFLAKSVVSSHFLLVLEAEP